MKGCSYWGRQQAGRPLFMISCQFAALSATHATSSSSSSPVACYRVASAFRYIQVCFCMYQHFWKHQSTAGSEVEHTVQQTVGYGGPGGTSWGRHTPGLPVPSTVRHEQQGLHDTEIKSQPRMGRVLN